MTRLLLFLAVVGFIGLNQVLGEDPPAAPPPPTSAAAPPVKLYLYPPSSTSPVTAHVVGAQGVVYIIIVPPSGAEPSVVPRPDVKPPMPPASALDPAEEKRLEAIRRVLYSGTKPTTDK